MATKKTAAKKTAAKKTAAEAQAARQAAAHVRGLEREPGRSGGRRGAR